jgi:hypothetical protein
VIKCVVHIVTTGLEMITNLMYVVHVGNKNDIVLIPWL